MASRYGRNKKRKHRARIAELEKSLKATERTRDEWKRSASKAVNNLRVLHEALNRVTPYSVFLPPRALRFEADQFRHMPFRVEHLQGFPPAYLGNDAADEPICKEVLDIPVSHVRAAIEKDRDKFQTLIHFSAVGCEGTKRASYMVSDEAMYHMRDFEGVVGRITEDCLRLLLEEFKPVAERRG